MTRNPVEQDIADIERLNEIVTTLAENEASHLVKKLGLKQHMSLKHRRKEEKPSPQRLREILEELGPTFIKFGQIMAQRPDLVPEKYRNELEKLEDDVRQFPGEEAREIVDSEVGLENFDSFNEEPIAAASIAQVHKASMDGKEVAVKVRRPGIKDQVTTDLDIMKYMAAQGEKHSKKLEQVRLGKIVNEFAEWTTQELDLKQEVRNAEIFQENLENEDNVKVPDVYPEKSTEKVMVMEYIEGTKCNDRETIEELDLDREKIAETAISAGLKQTIRDGFFHADPHPSNFLVQQDNTLVYLDFGMMGTISKKMRDRMGLLFMHAANEDIDGALNLITDMAYVEEDADIEGLRKDIEEKILEVKNTTLEENSITTSLLEISVQASEKGVHMPSSVVLIGKSLLTMEGIGLEIYPEFQLSDRYEEIARKQLMKNNQPQDLAESLAIDLIQNKDLISKAPTKINRTIENIQEKQASKIPDNSKNQKAVIAAGLLISSGLYAPSAFPREWLSLIALTEIILAGFLINELL